MSEQSASHGVVMFSGGLGSWAAGKRAAMDLGRNNLTLLFADTLVEDPDLYRFISSAARNIGPAAELVRVADGRTPFEVFHDDRFLGNARLANCSKFLKQMPCRAWLDANADPATHKVYVGIDWSEIHRLPAIRKGWSPYEVVAPLCRRPYLSKQQIADWARAEKLRPPRAYADGFSHNNCLQQGCVRGGQGHWRTILRERPAAYAESERQEIELRDYLDKDVTILRDRTGGIVTPMTLQEFRVRIEASPGLFDAEDVGGCGCFTAPCRVETPTQTKATLTSTL